MEPVSKCSCPPQTSWWTGGLWACVCLSSSPAFPPSTTKHLSWSSRISSTEVCLCLRLVIYELNFGLSRHTYSNPLTVLDIPWPDGEEELSPNSRNAIEILLTMDQNKRAGLKGEARCFSMNCAMILCHCELCPYQARL